MINNYNTINQHIINEYKNLNRTETKLFGTILNKTPAFEEFFRFINDILQNNNVNINQNNNVNRYFNTTKNIILKDSIEINENGLKTLLQETPEKISKLIIILKYINKLHDQINKKREIIDINTEINNNIKPTAEQLFRDLGENNQERIRELTKKLLALISHRDGKNHDNTAERIKIIQTSLNKILKDTISDFLDNWVNEFGITEIRDRIITNFDGLKTSIDLSSLRSTIFPKILFYFIHIQDLNLSNNIELSMYENIAGLFSFNNPKVILLTNLRTLNLSDNNIEEIRNNTFRNLNNLRILDLGKNQIRHIQPGTFDGLINLQELNLSHNQLIIQNLVNNFFNNLTSLNTLNLSNNILLNNEVINLVIDTNILTEFRQLNFDNNLKQENYNFFVNIQNNQNIQNNFINGLNNIIQEQNNVIIQEQNNRKIIYFVLQDHVKRNGGIEELNTKLTITYDYSNNLINN